MFGQRRKGIEVSIERHIETDRKRLIQRETTETERDREKKLKRQREKLRQRETMETERDKETKRKS